jgi:ribonuclease HI
MNEYLAWFDGACGPVNPGGTAAFGVVVRDGNGTVLLKECKRQAGYIWRVPVGCGKLAA